MERREMNDERKATSPAGYPVTLVVECATYQDARPYYVVARWSKKGTSVVDARYVPVVYGDLDRRPTPEAQRRAEAEARALAIFEAFASDAEIPRVGFQDRHRRTIPARVGKQTGTRTLTPEHLAA